MKTRRHLKERFSRPIAWLLSALLVGCMTALISLTDFDKIVGNISMLYLIVVTSAALLFGRAAAVLAALLSFLAIDFFFTVPHFHLSVQRPSEWLALCIFLFTAIVTGQLTALVRARAEEAERSRNEATALARASWAVASEANSNLALQLILEQTIPLTPARAACVIDNEPLGMLSASFNCNLEKAVFERFVRDRQDGTGANLESNGKPIFVHSHPLQEAGPTFFYCLDGASNLDQDELFKAVITHLKLVIGRDQLRRVEAQAAALLEADRLKTALLSMVSHDFRSPLTSIKTSVGSLLHEGVPMDQASQTQLLQGIEQETDRLNRLVGNVLDLSRIESGTWAPIKEPTPIAELVSATLASFDLEQNKRIKIEIDRSINEVDVDSVQIVQVLKNLIENALKYSCKDSEVCLAVSGDKSHVVFEVSDFGIGLPPGDEARIFEPFFRARQHKESNLPGLGVGLAVCKSLIDFHGGTLEAHSNTPKGSRFRVVLARSTEA